jgi:adenosylmethionine-8-amino-7-oxononanoate aminotransferase
VLLRPLGDVVVLMPPLTITSEELHRIVGALAESIRATTGGRTTGGRTTGGKTTG